MNRSAVFVFLILACGFSVVASPSTNYDTQSTPSEPNERIISAAQSLATSDYNYTGKYIRSEESESGKDSGARVSGRLSGRIEYSDKEVLLTASAPPTVDGGTYINGPNAWQQVGPDSEWQFAGTFSTFCDYANPVNTTRLETANYTVLNASSVNTTLKYSGKMTKDSIYTADGNVTTVISLDKNGRIDRIAETYQVQEGVETAEFRFGNYSTTTVEKPSLPFSVEATISKLLATIFGPHIDCT